MASKRARRPPRSSRARVVSSAPFVSARIVHPASENIPQASPASGRVSSSRKASIPRAVPPLPPRDRSLPPAAAGRPREPRPAAGSHRNARATRRRAGFGRTTGPANAPVPPVRRAAVSDAPAHTACRSRRMPPSAYPSPSRRGPARNPLSPTRRESSARTWRPGRRAMLADVTSGLSHWWAPAVAFAAGVLSFASPCVVPLVPGYLTFVSGTQGEEQRRPIVPILLFILGFGIVFTALGASASALRFIKSGLGLRLAGVVVLLFGAAMVLYALRLGRPELYAEKRPFLRWVKPGPAGALPLGMAFAAGWTPCVGPVLGGVLAIAGTQGGALKGATLLFVYSLGLGVPFLLMGLGVRAMMSSLDVIKRHYHVIAGVSGALMVGIGLLLVSGLWQRFLLPIISRLGQSSPPL